MKMWFIQNLLLPNTKISSSSVRLKTHQFFFLSLPLHNTHTTHTAAPNVDSSIAKNSPPPNFSVCPIQYFGVWSRFFLKGWNHCIVLYFNLQMGSISVTNTMEQYHHLHTSKVWVSNTCYIMAQQSSNVTLRNEVPSVIVTVTLQLHYV